MASSPTESEMEREDSAEESKKQNPAEDDTGSAAFELVSVTEQDLPVVETPTTLNVSCFSSHNSQFLSFYDPDTQDPHVPVELPTMPYALPAYDVHEVRTPVSPGAPVTKIQPFFDGEDLSGHKTVCWPFVSRRLLALLIILVLLMLSLALGIGLGVGLVRCPGRFRCASSVQCISQSAVCNGVRDCPGGDDELSCVRVSGKSPVLQVFSRGLWRTVCSEGWDSQLGSFACRQLGYNSYVSSSAVLLSSVEVVFQRNLVAFNISQTDLQAAFKIQNVSYFRRGQCSSGGAVVIRCLECGSAPAPQARITGGNVSRVERVPWQVSLNYLNQAVCGGSVISDRWVVTAAHCVYGFAQPDSWGVFAGIVDQPLGGYGALAVEKIIYHSRFTPKRLSHDIALIKLKLPLTFTNKVAPICLPSHAETFKPGQMCVVSGWGATVDGGEASVSLHSARVPLVSKRECHRPGLTSWNICTGSYGGAGTCQGDTGGPLACWESVWTLLGVTTWAQSCGHHNTPDVYTSITEALTWIHGQMEKEEEGL